VVKHFEAMQKNGDKVAGHLIRSIKGLAKVYYHLGKVYILVIG